MKSIPLLFLITLAVSCSEKSEFFQRKSKDSSSAKTAKKSTPDSHPSEKASLDASPSTTLDEGGSSLPLAGTSADDSNLGTNPGSNASTETAASSSSSSSSSTNPSQDVTIPTEVKTEQITEHYNQLEESKLDIIWVVDNSSSMQDEQESLAKNFNAFIESFIHEKVDFQMAITTTDTSGPIKGLTVPGSIKKLNSKAAQANPALFMADFMKMIRVGISGSGYEKGLEALDGFLQTNGKSFLREDAYLIAIVVSDEEDQSPNSVDYYINALKKVKKNEGSVKVYSIVDTLRTRNTNTSIIAGYKRYLGVSESTSGAVYDIKDDFQFVLNDLRQNLTNLLEGFALSHRPILETLEVYVDGKREKGISYDKTNRSIVFNQDAVPKPGAKIKVLYKTVK